MSFCKLRVHLHNIVSIELVLSLRPRGSEAGGGICGLNSGLSHRQEGGRDQEGVGEVTLGLTSSSGQASRPGLSLLVPVTRVGEQGPAPGQPGSLGPMPLGTLGPSPAVSHTLLTKFSDNTNSSLSRDHNKDGGRGIVAHLYTSCEIALTTHSHTKDS